MSVKVEVGRRYWLANDKVVGPMDRRGLDEFPFTPDDGETYYSQDGKRYAGNGPDIVAEVDPKADADGFIPWTGGACRVANAALVQVRYRYGGLSPVMRAHNFRWEHQTEGASGDVVAYRLASLPKAFAALPTAAAAECVPVASDFAEVGYESLAAVLREAHDRAAVGKGASRHANGKPFDEQPIFAVAERHGIGFLLGQADKKIGEARNLASRDAAEREYLDAIVYLAAAVIHSRKGA